MMFVELVFCLQRAKSALLKMRFPPPHERHTPAGTVQALTKTPIPQTTLGRVMKMNKEIKGALTPTRPRAPPPAPLRAHTSYKYNTPRFFF